MRTGFFRGWSRLRDYVKIDQTVYRPAEVDLLIGDASKAHSVLKWQPAWIFSV